MKKQKLIVVLGPTASGKTEVSLKLAKKYHGYIISADSRQIYKGMDIGTAKISLDKRSCYKKISHHLMDIISPDEPFSLAIYQDMVTEIIKREKGLPFLVGGTGLYISAIVDGYHIPRSKPDHALRLRLAQQSSESLVEILRQHDPNAADAIHTNNKRRIIRAIEVCMHTRKPLTTQIRKQKTRPLYDILQFGLRVDRAELYDRINHRVDAMIAAGFVDEVQTLLQKYDAALPAFSGIGYAEIILYLQRKCTKDQAIHKIKQRSRNYAKRQMSWFRRDKQIVWCTDYDACEKHVQKFLRE